ncbi:NAD synthetase [Sinorhizobium phage phiM9]|uniref:Putative homing endonuclease n=1 Tax=Sinorhizobium phage phiM9 TaxID=1636182 RepID=A0A0F6R4V3_9CAUD|nr:NAD synthetase [Sinorhizobium phage phiM9]AKE44662.1 putative homing endonuclease [Sinorhizobium phage phiM9]
MCHSYHNEMNVGTSKIKRLLLTVRQYPGALVEAGRHFILTSILFKSAVEPYGFIYETTCTVNGMKYLGRKVGDPDVESEYLGSGKHLVRAVKKHGRENFIRRIVEITTKDNHEEREQFWLDHYDCCNSRNWYNIGGSRFGGVSHTGPRENTSNYKGRSGKRNEEQRRRMRKPKKARTQEEWNYIHYVRELAKEERDSRLYPDH